MRPDRQMTLWLEELLPPKTPEHTVFVRMHRRRPPRKRLRPDPHP